jgi:signal transduction histidine kinase
MSGISAVCTLLSQNSAGLTAEQKSLVHIGTVCTQQLSLLIRDILDFSRMEDNNILLLNETFSLSDRIYEAIDLVEMEAQRANIDILCDIDPQTPAFVQGDPGRLMQVCIDYFSLKFPYSFNFLFGQILIHLLNNAIKFTEPKQKGEVILTVSSSITPPGTAQKVPPEDSEVAGDVVWIKFEVEDNGIGIPAVSTLEDLLVALLLMCNPLGEPRQAVSTFLSARYLYYSTLRTCCSISNAVVTDYCRVDLALGCP